jgi:hypothetical protein
VNWQILGGCRCELGEDVARPAGPQAGLGLAAVGLLDQAALTAKRSADFATYAAIAKRGSKKIAAIGDGLRVSQCGLMILIRGY